MNTTRVHPERVYHPDQSQRIAELESRLAKITADWERLEAENVELNMQLAQYKRAAEIANDECKAAMDDVSMYKLALELVADEYVCVWCVRTTGTICYSSQIHKCKKDLIPDFIKWYIDRAKEQSCQEPK